MSLSEDLDRAMLLLAAAELAVDETEVAYVSALEENLGDDRYSPEEVGLMRRYAAALDVRTKHSIRMRKLIKRVVREEGAE